MINLTKAERLATSPLEPTLPGSCYLEEAFFAREREAIFFKEWVGVARAEALPEVGDYLQLELLGQRLLLVRGKDLQIRGFYDVCRHRGCALSIHTTPKPLEGMQPGPSGKFKNVIQCKYHSWVYDLNGQLKVAPFLEESINKADLSLYPLGVALWGGWIFVNLSPQEAEARGWTLERQLGAEIAYSKNYPLADLRLGGRLVYNVKANWKVIIENYNECYHCAGVHPELCDIVPAFKQAGGMSLDWSDGVPHRDGAFTFSFSGTSLRAPFPGLSEAEKVNHKGQLIFPNMMISLAAEHVAAFTLWPQHVGETRIICDFLFHPDELDKATFDPSEVMAFWDLVNKQDWVVCEAVQQGMKTRVFKQGYYAPMEDLAADMRRYIAAKLGDL
ncbi:MAG: aromatic ring-hydroxylating dioxygenase subunit alpha [Trueperaceae bacterium]|nr:aromatic ring-hydroxylating dioxygenase subunit alpha [Trueperaceae bacterium]